ncbi:MAG: class I SAM-dependent methyltransferase [Actinobacteria bacterium]|nr:class I SAM-dependent methyltransferase [Actinomycetota bacterium]
MTDEAPVVPSSCWFGPLARFLGPAYLRNAFTKGTVQEVDFLWDALDLASGQSVLDVGCGPGRHSLELARRGIGVLGVDASDDFIALARASAEAEHLPARFEVADVRDLAYDGIYDAVICLCQGGFGLLGGRDEVDVFHRIVRAARSGGAVAVSAFHAPFALRHLEDGETYDAATGVLHERSMLRDADGNEEEFDLWTTCFTTRELELLAALAGLDVQVVHGVTPGRYRAGAPDLDAPELLLVGRRST